MYKERRKGGEVTPYQIPLSRIVHGIDRGSAIPKAKMKIAGCEIDTFNRV